MTRVENIRGVMQLLVSIFLLVMLSGCSLSLDSQSQTNRPRLAPPRSAKQPVMYPNAVSISTTVDTGSWPIMHTTFETTDSQATVDMFYKTTLGRDGWVVDAEGRQGAKLALSFSWYDGVERS